MAIHLGKLRWLFWLRWKMFTRSFVRGGASRIIGVVILGLFLAIFGGSFAITTYFAYTGLAAPANAEVLFLVLTVIYVIWIVLPLLQVNTNEGLDLSKLAQFPLTRGELMASLVLSTLLDIPTLGLLLMFGAVVAGWSASTELTLFALLAVIIFYIQLIAISQLILAFLQPLLQSRRFRDFSVLLAVVLGLSLYFCQFAFRGIIGPDFINNLFHAPYSPFLQWLPPGMAARAIQQASIGNWELAVVWLIALLIASVVILYLWQLLVERGMTQIAEGSPQARGTRRQRITQAEAVGIVPNASGASPQAGQGPALSAADTAPTTRRWLPVQVTDIAIKDLKYYWRDPQMKALLIRSLFSVVALTIAFVYPQLSSSRADAYGSIGHWVELTVPNLALLSLFTLSYNALGFERESLTTLFLFPIPPKYILWGKNLVVLLLGAVEILVLAILVAALSGAWELILPSLAIGIAGMGIITAIANFTSVFFPQRARLVTRGFRSGGSGMSTENGCLQAVTSFVAFIVTILVLLPVVASIVIPYISGAYEIWFISVPGTILYGIIIYVVVTTLVAPRMLDRTPEILAVITRE
jgi:ABC-2 type transport system permease protein